jgi:hypothetical protein
MALVRWELFLSSGVCMALSKALALPIKFLSPAGMDWVTAEFNI